MSLPTTIPINEILGTLRELMLGDESAPSRVAAAKILLERLAPKEDDEQRRREAEDRAAARPKTVPPRLPKPKGFWPT